MLFEELAVYPPDHGQNPNATADGRRWTLMKSKK
jgi:hypothetical protein